MLKDVDFILDIVPAHSTKGSNWKSMKPTSITIHNTGNYNARADAKMHARYIKNPTTVVSWHYTVDDKCIIQHFEHDTQCWHAGTNAGNTTSIGIEICVNPETNYEKSLENAAWLTATIMKEENIKEVKQHWHWSGKDCPAEIRYRDDWDRFLKLVDNYLNEEEVSDWAKQDRDELVELKITDGTRPKELCTREEVWVMLNRMRKAIERR